MVALGILPVAGTGVKISDFYESCQLTLNNCVYVEIFIALDPVARKSASPKIVISLILKDNELNVIANKPGIGRALYSGNRACLPNTLLQTRQ